MYDLPGDQPIFDEICNISMLFISTCLQHGCSLVRFFVWYYLHLISQYLVEIFIYRIICVQLGISLKLAILWYCCVEATLL